MTTPRDILDVLGRDTLVRLIRERNLSASRENDDRRTSLSRSYRGEVETLILELSRTELIEVFRAMWFWVGEEKMELRNPSQYRLEELRAFAIRAFVGRRVRTVADFDSYADPDDQEEDDADEEDEEDEDEEVDGDAIEDGGESVEAEGDSDDAQIFHQLTDEWSRPRMIARVMRRLGFDAPSRLRTTRFHELVVALKEQGIDACLAYDDDHEVLTEEHESPGIAAKVRLRRLSEANGAARSARGQSPIATPRTKTSDTGPPIVVQPGERPVTQRTPRPADYNLAVLRLQFLTAVPSVERRTMAQWPDAYLRAASASLTLRPQEIALLRALSAGLCYGNHSPYDAIPQLTQALTADEWKALLGEFVALNPFQPDFVQAIVTQIQPIQTPRADTDTWRDAVPTPPDLIADEPDTDKHQMPLAAAGKSVSADETNVRDLGALAGMFEDE